MALDIIFDKPIVNKLNRKSKPQNAGICGLKRYDGHTALTVRFRD